MPSLRAHGGRTDHDAVRTEFLRHVAGPSNLKIKWQTLARWLADGDTILVRRFDQPMICSFVGNEQPPHTGPPCSTEPARTMHAMCARRSDPLGVRQVVGDTGPVSATTLWRVTVHNDR
jgi:hypothetical protein